MHLTADQWIHLIEILAPVLLAIIGMIFKVKQDTLAEVQRAITYVLKEVSQNRMDSVTAKNQILATGAVPEHKADMIVSAIGGVKVALEADKEMKKNEAAAYQNAVIPGVGVTINHDGTYTVEILGFLNRAAHFIMKVLKQKK